MPEIKFLGGIDRQTQFVVYILNKRYILAIILNRNPVFLRNKPIKFQINFKQTRKNRPQTQNNQGRSKRPLPPNSVDLQYYLIN